MAVSMAAKAFAVLAEELLRTPTLADQDAAARLQARFTDASAPMAYVATGVTSKCRPGIMLKFGRGTLLNACNHFWCCRLVVLDEVDYLTMKDQDVLYRMFEWAARPGSRLILIGMTSKLKRWQMENADLCDLRPLIPCCFVGIANALDLTDRLLPRLRAASRTYPTHAARIYALLLATLTRLALLILFDNVSN